MVELFQVLNKPQSSDLQSVENHLIFPCYKQDGNIFREYLVTRKIEDRMFPVWRTLLIFTKSEKSIESDYNGFTYGIQVAKWLEKLRWESRAKLKTLRELLDVSGSPSTRMLLSTLVAPS